MTYVIEQEGSSGLQCAVMFLALGALHASDQFRRGGTTV